jgi:hypothetical protein
MVLYFNVFIYLFVTRLLTEFPMISSDLNSKYNIKKAK